MRAPIAILALLLATSIAHADTDLRDLASRAGDKLDRVAGVLDDAGIDREITMRIGRAAVKRARRSVAVGPHVGAFQQIDAVDSAGGFGLSFGLGFYMFDIPMGLDLKEEIKQLVKDEIKARLSTGQSQIDVREIIERIVIQAIEGKRSTWQPPRLSIVAEGFTTFGDADAFGARALVGYGISKVSIAMTAAVQRAHGDTIGTFGPELAVRLTPIGDNRTPVFDLFGRYEVATGSDAPGTPQSVSVGARLLLDVL